MNVGTDTGLQRATFQQNFGREMNSVLLTRAEQVLNKEACKDEALGIQLLLGADRNHFGGLLTNLENQLLTRNDN